MAVINRSFNETISESSYDVVDHAMSQLVRQQAGKSVTNSVQAILYLRNQE